MHRVVVDIVWSDGGNGATSLADRMTIDDG